MRCWSAANAARRRRGICVDSRWCSTAGRLRSPPPLLQPGGGFVHSRSLHARRRTGVLHSRVRGGAPCLQSHRRGPIIVDAASAGGVPSPCIDSQGLRACGRSRGAPSTGNTRETETDGRVSAAVEAEKRYHGKKREEHQDQVERRRGHDAESSKDGRGRRRVLAASCKAWSIDPSVSVSEGMGMKARGFFRWNPMRAHGSYAFSYACEPSDLPTGNLATVRCVCHVD